MSVRTGRPCRFTLMFGWLVIVSGPVCASALVRGQLTERDFHIIFQFLLRVSSALNEQAGREPRQAVSNSVCMRRQWRKIGEQDKNIFLRLVHNVRPGSLPRTKFPIGSCALRPETEIMPVLWYLILSYMSAISLRLWVPIMPSRNKGSHAWTHPYTGTRKVTSPNKVVINGDGDTLSPIYSIFFNVIAGLRCET